MIDALTKSADDTRELGAAVAGVVTRGDVVLLAGDLGAGKTTLTQGFARGLGVTEQVTSPTFVLMRPYDGRLPIVHVDAYRLEHLQEVIDLGLPELLDDGAVAIIEWGDVVAPALPPDFLELRLEYREGEDERDVHLRIAGPRWAARKAALRTAVDRWVVA
ncbi:MAG: tRNA threonylcarbamoyladenosine biosynthesis protein TsaE [Actinomycetota bacterium]|jgi:tRNA threonylcarbamoyladenosine biosynthesis protein TsaE